MSIIVFASQTGLMYCCSRRQNFYGSTFKMWQINITKSKITQAALWVRSADPCHSGRSNKCLTNRYRVEARGPVVANPYVL